MSVNKQVSLHGRRAYVTKDDQVGARNGFVAGGVDRAAIQLPGSPDTVAVFDDFLGAIDDTGKPFPGSGLRALVGDTGHTSGIQAGTNGVYRLMSAISAGAAKAASAGVAIGGGALNWKGNQGPGSQSGRLRFGARVKISDVTRTEATGSNRAHMFAGFTDIATYEFPAYDTGAGVISNAADYVGFLFSPGGDTGISGVAGKSTAGDSGDQVVALDTGLAGNRYTDLELEFHRSSSDTGGTVTFYVDGEAKGSISSPISPTVALSPVIAAFSQDTGDNFVDVDWVNVSAPRDTGL